MPRERTDDAIALAEYAAELAVQVGEELRAMPQNRQEQHRTAYRRRDAAREVANVVALDDPDFDE